MSNLILGAICDLNINQIDKWIESTKEHFKGDIISESEVNKMFNELYGKKSDRIKLANKINALMEANESLKSYMNIYIAENLPSKIKIT